MLNFIPRYLLKVLKSYDEFRRKKRKPELFELKIRCYDPVFDDGTELVRLIRCAADRIESQPGATLNSIILDRNNNEVGRALFY